MSDDVQCPNCGGYKIDLMGWGSRQAGCFIDFILIFATAGVWLIVVFLKYIFGVYTIKPGKRLMCDQCGYKWIYEG